MRRYLTSISGFSVGLILAANFDLTELGLAFILVSLVYASKISDLPLKLVRIELERVKSGRWTWSPRIYVIDPFTYRAIIRHDWARHAVPVILNDRLLDYWAVSEMFRKARDEDHRHENKDRERFLVAAVLNLAKHLSTEQLLLLTTGSVWTGKPLRELALDRVGRPDFSFDEIRSERTFAIFAGYVMDYPAEIFTSPDAALLLRLKSMLVLLPIPEHYQEIKRTVELMRRAQEDNTFTEPLMETYRALLNDRTGTMGGTQASEIFATAHALEN